MNKAEHAVQSYAAGIGGQGSVVPGGQGAFGPGGRGSVGLGMLTIFNA